MTARDGSVHLLSFLLKLPKRAQHGRVSTTRPGVTHNDSKVSAMKYINPQANFPLNLHTISRLDRFW